MNMIGSNGSVNRNRAAAAARILMTAFIAAKLLFLFLLAGNSVFVMDEYTLAAHTQYVDQFYHSYFPFKTVLSSFIYLPAYLLSSGSAQMALALRYQGAVLAIVMVLFVYLISRNMGRDRMEAIFAVCVALAVSTFMERIFRIRTEPIATLFAIMALWFVTKPYARNMSFICGGLLSGLAFLTTQKSVYFIAALLAAIIVDAAWRREPRQLAAYTLYYLAGCLLAIAAYGLYFGGAGFHSVIWHVLAAPLRLALHGGADYENLGQFIWTTLSRNVLPYGICAAGLVFAIVRFSHLSSVERKVLVFTALTAFMVFTHNQPWPYVFTMAIPFLALFGPYALLAVTDKRPDRKYAAMLAAVLLLAVSFDRNMHFFGSSNVVQIETSNQADSLLGPNDYYCDGTGMLLKRKFIRAWWDAGGIASVINDAKRGGYKQIDDIFSMSPKVWIFNYRINKLWPLIGERLTNSYVRIFPNVLVSGAPVQSGKETVFKNWWEGVYSLYEANGSRSQKTFVLDGISVSGPIRVKRGARNLGLPEQGTCYLLPAGIDSPFQIPPRSNPYKLYQRVYGY